MGLLEGKDSEGMNSKGRLGLHCSHTLRVIIGGKVIAVPFSSPSARGTKKSKEDEGGEKSSEIKLSCLFSFLQPVKKGLVSVLSC